MNIIKTKKTVPGVLLVAVLSLSALSASGAATWYVATTGNDANHGTQALPFGTISKGLATATSGDSILVGAGTFAELITWSGKSLNVQGAGADQSVIDGLGSGTCLTLTNVPTTARLEGFTIRNGMWNGSNGTSGGGMSNTGSHPTIANCTFTANSAGRFIGGGMFNSGSNPTLINCTFIDNNGNDGGGIYNANSSPALINCVFTSNGAGRNGGGMANSGSNPILINCRFLLNVAANGNGGGMFNVGSNPTLTHCTLSRNIADTGGGIFTQGNTPGFSPKLNNCIVWGNVVGSGHSAIAGLTPSTVTYSDVQGGYPGTGNIDADPLFVSFAAGNNHLQPTSPCIDKGSAAAPSLPVTDLDGAPRVQGSAPDMGAYEFGSWFVDNASGSDTNPGLPAAPFATVTRAITAALNGNNIYVQQGNYSSDRPRITKALRLFNWGDTGLARIGAP